MSFSRLAFRVGAATSSCAIVAVATSDLRVDDFKLHLVPSSLSQLTLLPTIKAETSLGDFIESNRVSGAMRRARRVFSSQVSSARALPHP